VQQNKDFEDKKDDRWSIEKNPDAKSSTFNIACSNEHLKSSSTQHHGDQSACATVVGILI
jgi:hypothetical protein